MAQKLFQVFPLFGPSRWKINTTEKIVISGWQIVPQSWLQFYWLKKYGSKSKKLTNSMSRRWKAPSCMFYIKNNVTWNYPFLGNMYVQICISWYWIGYKSSDRSLKQQTKVLRVRSNFWKYFCVSNQGWLS